MNLIIYGIGDFAELTKYYFESDSKYKVVAFCVDKQYQTKDMFCDLPIVTFEDVNRLYSNKTHDMFVAVGYSNMRARKEMFLKAKAKGYTLASYISSTAHLDDSNKLGQNCMLLHGAILEPFVHIQDNCFINTAAVVCHHAHIESHCFIAAKALIGGFSKVGSNSFIGFQSTVIQKLCLGGETLLAANSLLLKDSEESSMYVGSPAKIISKHKLTGIQILD